MQDESAAGAGAVGGPGASDQFGSTWPSSADEAGRPAVALRHPLPLLESLFRDHLDPGYLAAAERAAADRAAADRAANQRAAARRAVAVEGSGEGDAADRPVTRRQRTLALLGAGLVLIGVVLGTALSSTKDQSAGTQEAKMALLQDIDQAQASQALLESQQSALAAALRSAQSSLGIAGHEDTARRLEIDGGQTAVMGPGLTIVLDDSKTSPGSGEILDRDLQLLVNGLWSSGAEAVSIGGVRLRVTSSIRQAGTAILVDNRPVFFPLTVEAVGDPSVLHVRFVDTVGFGRFETFVSLYGIRFDISAQTGLTLPAAGAPDLRYASAPTATTTPGANPLSSHPAGPDPSTASVGRPPSTNEVRPSSTSPAAQGGTAHITESADTAGVPAASSR